MMTVNSVRDVKRRGRRINVNGFSTELVRELVQNKEALIAVYREGLFDRTAQIIPDRQTFEAVKGRTAFKSIKGLKFYAAKMTFNPYRNIGIESFMATPARLVA
jgi:hypothetical protein